MPVDLIVEQSPAAGRARILMHSPTLARQFTVDWEHAEEIHKDWQSVIDGLAVPPPTIPNRLVLPCGMTAWEDEGGGLGLYSLLNENEITSDVNWDGLANKLAQRFYGEYCISSDGTLPPQVGSADIARLDRLTGRAVELVTQMAAGDIPPDTAPLKFLTWQFRRCPQEIATILLDAWQPGHPLVKHAATRILLYQGIGRIAAKEVHEARALETLLRKPVPNWNWRIETACAAFLLSRSDSAPRLLTREDVDLLAQRVVLEFQENIGTEYTMFNYAPFLLVGLLRWRLKEPKALVAGTDPAATLMSENVKRALHDLNRNGDRSPRILRYIRILEQVQTELHGSGTNPDILLDIYG